MVPGRETSGATWGIPGQRSSMGWRKKPQHFVVNFSGGKHFYWLYCPHQKRCVGIPAMIVRRPHQKPAASRNSLRLCETLNPSGLISADCHIN